MKKELDPRVRFELDVFWAAITGNAPEKVLREWKGRVRSIHLKEIAPRAMAPEKETEVMPEYSRELDGG